MAGSWRLAPDGLLIALLGSDEPPPLLECPEFRNSGLIEFAVPLRRLDVAWQKVRPIYLNMYYYHGLQKASVGDNASAIDCLRKALAIDPEFRPATEALAGLENGPKPSN
jgi:hypothetical protein